MRDWLHLWVFAVGLVVALALLCIMNSWLGDPLAWSSRSSARRDIDAGQDEVRILPRRSRGRISQVDHAVADAGLFGRQVHRSHTSTRSPQPDRPSRQLHLLPSAELTCEHLLRSACPDANHPGNQRRTVS
jgi:hypothetical protein